MWCEPLGERGAAVPAQVEIAGRLLAALAAEPRCRARRLDLQLAQQRACARLVAVASDPHLRLRDVGWHVTDDARHVLVEDVRTDARLIQPIGDEVGVVTLARHVHAFHRRPLDGERTIMKMPIDPDGNRREGITCSIVTTKNGGTYRRER